MIIKTQIINIGKYINIFMYWKVCDMEKEGKLNVRQHIEKERLQLNEITPHLSKFATFFRKECILILYSGQPMAIFSFAGSFIDNTDFYSSTRAIYRRLFKIKQLLFLQRNQSSHLKGHLGPHVSDRKGCVYVTMFFYSRPVPK